MKRWFPLLAASLWALASCTPAAAPASEVEVLPVLLAPSEVQARLDKGSAIVVDVRQLDEWIGDGHITGATLIPLTELPDRLGELQPDDEIILVCRSGNRSQTARRILEEAGFGNLHELQGGMRAWMADRLPVEYGQ